MNEARDFFRFLGEAFMYAAPVTMLVVAVVWALCWLFPSKGTTYGGGPR